MQENQLYALWQALGRSGQWVQDGHHRLRVLEPGTLNLSFGPDFTGARFDLDGVRVSGDVEMHIRQNEWYQHGHHLDPFYKNVALHVVFSPPQGKAQVHSQVSQRFIPSFYLNQKLLSQAVAHPALRCLPADEQSLIQALPALQELAVQRLESKIHFYLKEMQSKPLAQVFYETFFKILGYPKNGLTFRLLAQQLPLSWLERSWLTPWFGFDLLYALYAGQAGFLDANFSDSYVQRLQFYYHEYRNSLPSEGLTLAHWQFSGVRACNHPHFRLAAWVALLAQKRNLPHYVLFELFAQRFTYRQLYTELLHFFRFPLRGYWQHHYHLGSAPLKRASKYYFGPARIIELSINLFIPLFSVQALQNGSQGFVDYLYNFYLWLPQVTSYHALTKYFPWWKQYLKQWPHQALWQGLIELNLKYCSIEACDQCPLRHTFDK